MSQCVPAGKPGPCISQYELLNLAEALGRQLWWIDGAIRKVDYSQWELQSRWATLALVQPPTEESVAHLQQVMRLCQELSAAKPSLQEDTSNLEKAFLALYRALAQQEAETALVMPAHWPSTAAAAPGPPESRSPPDKQPVRLLQDLIYGLMPCLRQLHAGRMSGDVGAGTE